MFSQPASHPGLSDRAPVRIHGTHTNVKFVYLTTLYSSYVDYFYSRQPALRRASFEAQHDALASDHFGSNGAWKASLEQFGYEVVEVYGDVAPLQSAWASQAGLKERMGWKSIVAAQVAAIRPDILLVDDSRAFDADWLAETRAMCGSIRLVLVHTGVAGFGSAVGASDLVVTSLRSMTTALCQDGLRTEYWPHAFNQSVWDRLDGEPARHPASGGVVFTGGLVRSKAFHGRREKLLARMLKELPVAIYTPMRDLSPPKEVAKFVGRVGLHGMASLVRGVGNPEGVGELVPWLKRSLDRRTLPRFPINWQIRRSSCPAVYGMEMYRTLLGAGVVLNSHIDFAGGEAGNMRLFEATGVGVCLLTDGSASAKEFFTPDSEVVVYDSADECIERARWLLDHPEEADAIGRAAKIRVAKDHTFAKRVELLDGWIRSALR
jgi:spore maturation protein CgeB